MGYSAGVKESELDWRICSRARLSRDPRFDGKFFIGVHGSGVYCRPVCPAPTAKEKNCRYFATAAAAAEAGYRPCLRCRPECAPGTPAWLGTSASVARALRLIETRGLEEDGIEGLAERLGMSSRHLRRLFIQHLGATPLAVAQTRRLHFAKKLIDETKLSMTEVALAAGYGSVRRFNAAIAKTYRRTPSQIRANARAARSLPENEYLFLLRFRPPFDWPGMLALLRSTAVPDVESVDENAYRRTIDVGGCAGDVHVSLDPSGFALRARIRFGNPRALFAIVERLRRIFDLNADWASVEHCLGADPLLALRLKAKPGLRVPGCWDPFELAVILLLSRGKPQHEAREGIRSLVHAFGRPVAEGCCLRLFPEPRALLTADLHPFGVARETAGRISALATAVCEGRIAFDGVLDSESLLRQLRSLTDMDGRSAQYFAMRALGEPDAFPLEGFAASRLHERAERWRPWRAYAAIYLGTAFTPAGAPSANSSFEAATAVAAR